MSVKAVGAELVAVHEPLKPGSEPGEPPTGTVPLYERLVTVTTLPSCEKVPFQPCVIVCPFANEN